VLENLWPLAWVLGFPDAPGFADGMIQGPTPPSRPPFHPVFDGGVVHERRHALTWALSPGVSWDETDLST
jgi:hypothetical protein